jgi:MFS family permease
MICWAVIFTCYGAVSSFASLMVLRFLLGAMESVISPGFSLITSLWYKPSEHALRHGMWFAGNGMGQHFWRSPRVCNWLHRRQIGRLAAWRWLFIIFGLVTFAWSIVLVLVLLDSALKLNGSLHTSVILLTAVRRKGTTASSRTNGDYHKPSTRQKTQDLASVSLHSLHQYTKWRVH